MLTLRRIALVLLTLPLLGCPELGKQEQTITEELPENPTWSEHVKPILDTYCNECHSVPPQQLAPPNIRLDTCEDVGGVFGAQNQAIRIVFRTIDQVPSPMPPSTYGIYPSEFEQAILQRWVDQGASCEGGVNVMPNNVPGDMDTPNIDPGDMGMPNSMPGDMNMGMDTGMDMGMDMDMAPDMPVPATWNQVASMMITPCTGCHGGGAGGLQWTNVAELRTAIENQQASDMLNYVEPNEPELSHLYLRVSSDDPGFLMPRNGARIDNLVMAMESWINNGADFDN